MRYHVYILSSKSRVIYVGVTGCLMSRVLRHKAGQGGAFTSKYRVHRLVYYQAFQMLETPSPVKQKSRAGAGRRKSR